MQNYVEGKCFSKCFVVSKELEMNYINLLGDKNPLHWDYEYTKKTKFYKPIVHGDLIVGLISSIVGTEFPVVYT